MEQTVDSLTPHEMQETMHTNVTNGFLSLTSDLNSDVLVMSCDGHSRFCGM